MRYVETKERSNELLRLSLPLMARQHAAYHPLSYALWYEHLAGINPALSTILTQRLDADVPLSDDEVYRLHARHIVSRDVEALERLQGRLDAVLAETALTAAEASAEASTFGHILGRHQETLDRSSNEQIRQTMTELMEATGRMRGVTRQLVERLESSAQDLRTLHTELSRAQSEALLDALTGLRNRRGLERAVDAEVAQTAGLEGVPLLMADIDHFKRVNDRYGHLLGDKVIRVVAQAITTNLRGREIAARVGGEEFVVVLPRMDARAAVALAEQLRTAVAMGRIHRGESAESIDTVTLSLGLAIGRRQESLEELMGRADEALYAAKRRGRNRTVEWQPDIAQGSGPNGR
jgi:diguanylate cyclase